MAGREAAGAARHRDRARPRRRMRIRYCPPRGRWCLFGQSPKDTLPASATSRLSPSAEWQYLPAVQPTFRHGGKMRRPCVECGALFLCPIVSRHYYFAHALDIEGAGVTIRGANRAMQVHPRKWLKPRRDRPRGWPRFFAPRVKPLKSPTRSGSRTKLGRGKADH